VTGIAPFISYGRHAEEEWTRTLQGDHRLFLIQGASRASEVAYRDEIETLAHAFPGSPRPDDQPSVGTSRMARSKPAA